MRARAGIAPLVALLASFAAAPAEAAGPRDTMTVAGPYSVVVTDLSIDCPVAFH